MDTNIEDSCLCVGGPLHGYPLPATGASAHLMYRPSGDLRDPLEPANYPKQTLERPASGGVEQREFFVFDKISLRHALQLTAAAPEHFWK